MPDEQGPESWTPQRGRLFKALIWVLLVLIALGVLGGVVIGVML